MEKLKILMCICFCSAVYGQNEFNLETENLKGRVLSVKTTYFHLEENNQKGEKYNVLFHQYNSEGNLVEERGYNEADSLLQKTTYTYENGKLTEKVVFEKKYLGQSESRRYKKGEIDEKVITKKESLFQKITYTYNSNGFCEQKYDWRVYKIYTKSFNKTLNIFEEKNTESSRLIPIKEECYIHDSKNRLQSFEICHKKAGGFIHPIFEEISKNERECEKFHISYENEPLKETMIIKNPEGDILNTTIFEYDPQGNIIKETEETTNEKRVTFYDTNGNNVKAIISLKEKETEHIITYLYKYDTFGNWMEYKSYENETPSVVAEREIVYFP